MEESLLNDISLSKLNTSQFLTELPHLLVRHHIPANIVQLIQEHIDYMWDQRYQEGYADGFLKITPEGLVSE